jgi:hypothetical protein
MSFTGSARLAGLRTLAAALTLALAACGAGVVGTGSGTGDDSTQDIQYDPRGLCTADFAATALRCSAVSPDPFRGTQPMQWSDADKDHDAAVLVGVEGNGVGLQWPCKQLAFLGTWGQLPDGTLGFVGRYVSPQSSAGRPGVLHVMPAPNEPTAVGWVELVDAAGLTVAGPWLVRLADTPVKFAPCAP